MYNRFQIGKEYVEALYGHPAYSTYMHIQLIWGRKELDTTERLNWTELNWMYKNASQVTQW